jgi:hypothetical protein
MPDEYISRAKALSAVQKQRGANRSPAQNDMLDRICRNIKNMPAADVAPVVHGWWKKVRKSRSTWECSVCGTKVGAFFVGCSQYCYCCGAQMGGITE